MTSDSACNIDYGKRRTQLWFRYRGRDRDGQPRSGTTGVDPTTFVRTRFRRGWRQLVVTHPYTGNAVAGIDSGRATGHPSWWSSFAPPIRKA
jgi:hypothetical protein